MLSNLDDIFLQPPPKKPSIDAVVVWCDSTEQHINSVVSNMSSYDLRRVGKRLSLKYTLRGLYYNLPWLNNIFLVTNNQWPKFLCEKKSLELSPKIVRIDHRDIHPQKKPMYGCSRIEPCLSNIPNLSEYFLLANDDTFVIKPMSIVEWIYKNHKGIYRYIRWPIKHYQKHTKGYKYWDVLRPYQIIKDIYPNAKFFRPSHQIQILHKKSFDIAKKHFPELYERTINTDGRPEQDRITRTMLEYIGLNEKLFVGISDHPHSPDSLYIESYYKKENVRQRLKKLSLVNIPDSKKLLCINNIFDLDEIPLLEKLFPIKIPSEI